MSISTPPGSYFCPVCQCIIRPTAIATAEHDGIDCQDQGREHIVYLAPPPAMRGPLCPFYLWTNEQIDTVARAMDSAAGEGAFGGESDLALADALRDEALARGIDLNAAYGLGPSHPDQWRKDLER